MRDPEILKPKNIIAEHSNLEFDSTNKQKLEKIQKAYPEARAMIMPTLWLAQDQWGWVSDEVMKYVAKVLNVPIIWVQEVASFYTMFNKEPVGKYHVQVCRNISCCLNGSEEILAYWEKKLGIKAGETTKDGKVTLSEVECLCACDYAPVTQINDSYFDNVTQKKIDKLVTHMKDS